MKILPKCYRNDPWVKTQSDATDIVLTDIRNVCQSNYNNIFFKSLDAWGLENYEYDLGITPQGTTQDRRNKIESDWKSASHCSLTAIQNICERYFKTDVTAEYDSDANVTFLAQLGFRKRYTDITLNQWKSDINIIFPAHFTYNWKYIQNVWGTYLNVNWKYNKTRTWQDTLEVEVE